MKRVCNVIVIKRNEGRSGKLGLDVMEKLGRGENGGGGCKLDHRSDPCSQPTSCFVLPAGNSQFDKRRLRFCQRATRGSIREGLEQLVVLGRASKKVIVLRRQRSTI